MSSVTMEDKYKNITANEGERLKILETFLEKNDTQENCMEKLCDEKQDSINAVKTDQLVNLHSYNSKELNSIDDLSGANLMKNIVEKNVLLDNTENLNNVANEKINLKSIDRPCGLQTLVTEIDYNLNIPRNEISEDNISKSSDSSIKGGNSGVDICQESENKMLNADDDVKLTNNDVIMNTTVENRKNSIAIVDKGIQETIQKVGNLDISENVQRAPCKSEVILKNSTDSLKHLLIYDNSTDDDDEYDEFEKNWQLQAVQSSSDSESDSTESLDECDTDDTADEISSDTVFTPNTGAIKKDCSKSSSILVDELDLYLPPLLDLSTLKIDYDKEEFLHIGKIKAIIETLVTVEAIPGTPAYDLDSVLFVNNQTTKRPLGTIYDVIGPVSAPIYCIRFDNKEQIDELCLKLGLNVYSAPKSEYTRYVFVKELMKLRGSDASWVGDKELPSEFVEISDGEDEDNQQETRKAPKRKYGSLERHQQFEKSMNKCNTLNTRVAQLVDAHRRLSRHRPIQDSLHQNSGAPRSDTYAAVAASSHMMDLSRLLAPFDPTIPPPGFRDSSMDRYRAHGNATRDGSTYGGPHPVWIWTPPELHQNAGYGIVRNAQSSAASGSGGGSGQRNVQGNNNSAHYRTNHAGRQAGPSNRPY